MTDKDFKKRIGAPPKRDPLPGERFTIATRVRPELKRRLDAAAEESGRSQAQETELRLERSFDRTDLLPEVLTLAYGERIAAQLMELGAAMKIHDRIASLATEARSRNKLDHHVWREWQTLLRQRIPELSRALMSLIKSNPRGPSREELEKFLQKQLLE
jgi:hypothetical protein